MRGGRQEGCGWMSKASKPKIVDTKLWILGEQTQLWVFVFFFPFFFTHVKMESKAGLEDFFYALVVMAPHL
jgi:hypothetical protein